MEFRKKINQMAGKLSQIAADPKNFGPKSKIERLQFWECWEVGFAAWVVYRSSESESLYILPYHFDCFMQITSNDSLTFNWRSVWTQGKFYKTGNAWQTRKRPQTYPCRKPSREQSNKYDAPITLSTKYRLTWTSHKIDEACALGTAGWEGIPFRDTQCLISSPSFHRIHFDSQDISLLSTVHISRGECNFRHQTARTGTARGDIVTLIEIFGTERTQLRIIGSCHFTVSTYYVKTQWLLTSALQKFSPPSKQPHK